MMTPFLTQLESLGLILAPLDESHADAVIAFEHSVFYEPWSDKSLINQLKHCRSYCVGVFKQDEIVAYASFSVLLDEAELYRLAVTPSYRRTGLAKGLLVYSLNQLRPQGVCKCLLEVNANNVAAVTLYETLGFGLDGIRKGYYDGLHGPEDARLMTWIFS